MSESPGKVFKCPACGTAFKWKPEFAGRKIACKCGKKFLVKVPVTAPVLPVAVASAPAPPPVEDAYDPAPEPVTEAPVAAAAPARAVPSPLTYIPGRRKQPVDAAEDLSEESAVKHTVVPIGLIALGVAGRLALAVLWPGKSSQTVGAALGQVTFEMILNVALGLLALLLASVIFSANFGPVAHAARKMAGMAIVAGLIGALCIRIDPDPRESVHGLVLAIHAIPIAYFILLFALFELDLQEALITAVIVGVLQGLAMCVVLRI